MKAGIYEERVVMFVDILGFRNYIEESVSNKEKIKDLKNCIERVKSSNDTSEWSNTFMMTQFSDSLVVSYAIEEESSIFHIIHKLSFSLVDFIQHGFIVRGGISVGSLIHDKDYIFGPAMNAAYDLEKNHAVFPRVILDKDFFHYIKHNKAHYHSDSEERKYIENFLKKDRDHWFYCDYISFKSVVESIGLDANEFPYYLSLISKITKDGFEKNTDHNVIKKYIWLQEKLKNELDYCQKIPLNRRKMENIDFYDAMDGIDDCSKISARVKKNLDL